MSDDSINVLTGPSPREVPLARAPLVRVIAQLRFPPILSIQQPDVASKFQDRVRDVYPFLSQDMLQAIQITNGSPQLVTERIWRFSDDEKDPAYRVSLGQGYVSLEVFHYESRTEFVRRVEAIVAAAQKALRPADVQRLGIRYVNRMTGDGWERRSALLASEILGVEGLFAGSDNAVVQALTEAHLVAKEGAILARFGTLQSNVTYDPDAVPVIASPSVVIDLDMYSTVAMKFESKFVSGKVREYCARLYAVFRNVVGDQFIDFYGGEI